VGPCYLHGDPPLPNLLQDVRFGCRQLRKHSALTAVAVLALSLGIGANTAIFSVVYATFLAPLPYRDPDRLVMVFSRLDGSRCRSGTRAAE
jgi:putative ABC transport system permease protein